MNTANPLALMVTTGIFNLDGGIAKVNQLVLSVLKEKYSVDVVALNEEKGSSSVHQYLRSYYRFGNRKLPFTFSVWGKILRNKYSMIYCDHVNLASMLAPLRITGCSRYLVWLHGVEVFPPRPDFEGKLGLTFAKQRLASSAFTRKKVLEQFPGMEITACNLSLQEGDVPQLKDGSLNAPLDLVALDHNRYPIGKSMILFVGRMDPLGRYKGQELLLKGFPTIWSNFPEAQLVLAGGGEDIAYYRELSKSLPQEVLPRIFLPGHVSSDLLKKLYQHSMVFAMPSLGEGFGLVYLEAMSHAKPCIACREDAASCVIEHGVTGLLVDSPVTPESVANSCMALLSQPEKSIVMGKAGYNLLQQQFLFTHFRERFWTAIQVD